MIPDHPENGSPLSTRAAAPGRPVAPGERERILAAVGWEADPRRRKVLRELLAEQCQRIYLHYYAASRSRSGAMDRTRRILLQVARSLDSIPERCPLTVWAYLKLEEGGIAAECPEPWRVLAGAGPSTGAEARTAAETPRGLRGTEEEALGRHLETHPGCRTTLEGFERYCALPEDGDAVIRSGWKAAAQDLDRFLAAQFSDEGLTPRTGTHWKRHLPSLRWARSRAVAGTVMLVAVLLAVLLLRAWFLNRNQQWVGGSDAVELSDSSAVPPVGPPAPAAARAVPTTPPPSGPTPETIRGAQVKVEGKDLRFQWDRAPGADSYRLIVLTAKLDTITVTHHLRQPGARIPVSSVRGLEPHGSYLFCADGLKGERVFASTGFTPFHCQ